MLYCLHTDVLARDFGISIGPRGENLTRVRLSQYEYLAEPEIALKAGSGARLLRVRVPLDSSCFATEVDLRANDINKIPDTSKIPDFWTTNPLPLVTKAFKELVEEVDPGVHQFFPVKIFIKINSKPVNDNTFYRFACGRIVDIPNDSVMLDGRYSDIYGSTDDFCQKIAYIQNNIDVAEKLEEICLFSILGHRLHYFASPQFIETARERTLKGFTETTEWKRGGVQHVRY